MTSPAVANASMDEAVNVNRLYVSKCVADTGPMQMRWRPGPQGRAMPFRKSPWKERYPELLTLLEDEPGLPKGNVVRRTGDR